jgi:hypothetical protein
LASSHGKVPCDGIGGTVKRLPAKPSLQHVGVPLIDSAVKFFSWPQSNIKGASFGFTTTLEYEEIRKKLEPRFCNLKSVNGNFQSTQNKNLFIILIYKVIKTTFFNFLSVIFFLLL